MKIKIKTNKIQKANLVIQNELADVKFSIQQNSDQILTIQKETSDIKNFASLKQSIGTGNDFSSIERDISVPRENVTKQSSLSTTMNNAPTPNQAKTDSRLIGKKLVIYGLAENIQDDKVVQTERDRNSLLQIFRGKMELKKNNCERLFKTW